MDESFSWEEKSESVDAEQASADKISPLPDRADARNAISATDSAEVRQGEIRWGYPGDDEGLVVGIVVAPGGQPVTNAQLEVLYYQAGDFHMLDEKRSAEVKTLSTGATDAAGRFQLRAPIDRPLAIRCKAQGYGPSTVSPAYAGESLIIRLHLSAKAVGLVHEEGTHEAIVDASVELWTSLDVRFVQSESTGPSGEFELNDIDPGDYFLRVRAEGFERPPSVPFRLEAKDAYRHDFALQRARVFRGVVVDEESGRGVPGASVCTNWLYGEVVACSADGSFEYPWATSGRIFARAEGYGGGSASIPAPGADSIAQIRLRKGRTVAGAAVDPSGRPLRGVYVAGLSTDAGTNRQSVDWQSTRTGEDGRFELNTLNVYGHHVLMLQQPGFGTRLVDLPSDELDQESLDVRELVLSPARVVGGSVASAAGLPLPNIVVSLQGHADGRDLLWPEEHDEFAPPKALIRHTTSDARGRFRFSDVAAGSYVVRSRLRKGAAEFGEAIHVDDAGADLEILIVHDLGHPIQGTVTDASGRPLSMIEVRVRSETEPAMPVVTVGTYPDGTFLVTSLPPGMYTVTARPTFTNPGREHKLAATSAMGVEPGERAVELVLRDASTIAGVLMDAEGAPLEGLTVRASGRGGLLDESVTDRLGRFTMAVPEEGNVEVTVVDRTLVTKVSARAGVLDLLLELSDGN